MKIPKKLLLFAGLSLLALACSQDLETPDPETNSGKSATYKEGHRPQFHFSPTENWINDPNGLTYHNGEYHLFYQYNPHGVTWGHMSWGHAVSKDLVHWEHLPVALEEEDNIMMFSGSAVSDRNNTSGFGTEENPPIVAIYTGHYTNEKRQNQQIAYSLDNGRTWTKYRGNPVLDIDKADFRDPKVIWHEPSGKWVMAVALSKDKKIHFYGSPDLKEWEFLSSFGPAASTEGLWECPDLFELPVENADGESRWVLQVDVNPGAVAGGSGGQYFIGHFDGTRFAAEEPAESPAAEPLWVDYGKDFYAAQSWSNVSDRRIWLAWMNNWQYAEEIPTNPWRGSMTIPREVSLRKYAEDIRLVQQPLQELTSLRESHSQITGLDLADEVRDLRPDGISGNQLEIKAVFDNIKAGEFGLIVRKGSNEETVVGYSPKSEEVFVDRSQSQQNAIHDDFEGRHAAPLKPEDGKITLHLLIDHSSVELFANNGRVVITERIFPAAGSDGVSLYAKEGSVSLTSLEAWELNSVWTK